MRLLTFSFLLLFSCTQDIKNKEIIISGQIKNLPENKVYLTDAYDWQVLLDSTVVTDGEFRFNLDTSKFKFPFLASIYVRDSNSRMRSLLAINYIRTNTKDTFANSGFMVNP